MSILKSSSTIKVMHEWMGREETPAFKPRKFGVNKPVKEPDDPYPSMPKLGFMDRLFGRSAKIEQD